MLEVDGYVSMMGKAGKVVSRGRGRIMAQAIGPSSSWSLEDHAANIYWTSKENTCSVRSVQGLHHGEVCKVHLS
jgi:hypothetical protein